MIQQKHVPSVREVVVVSTRDAAILTLKLMATVVAVYLVLTLLGVPVQLP